MFPQEKKGAKRGKTHAAKTIGFSVLLIGTGKNV